MKPYQSEKEFRIWLLNELRRVARMQPHKAKGYALQAARVGYGKYTCNNCKGVFGPKEVDADHISPVVPLTGFDSWDGVINRMFCREDGVQVDHILQVLCKPCHKDKSRAEMGVRAIHRGKKKARKCKS